MSSQHVPGLENDDVASRVVQEELRLLAVVQTALDNAGAANLAALKARELDDTRMLELRDEVATAKPEDLPALFEQMHHLGSLRAQRGKGIVGTIDRASPYFGHLRLEEDGKRRDVLVGGKSYVDSAAGVRIVDWRHAPISRIYYRYQQGDDYEESIGGRMVEGVVLARRGVAVAGGELVRVSAPEGTFVRGEGGVWRRADVSVARLRTERRSKDTTKDDRQRETEGASPPLHSATASGATTPSSASSKQEKHLPAIAALLDAAQFELITRPRGGLVAIQGSAGSGKTTVGLHRVAYLAFADPQRFRPDRMAVVVPNEALVRWIDRVLPSLGVEGVALTTFARMSRRVLASLFPRLPTTQNDDTPPIVSRAKTSARMLHAIHAAAHRAHETMGIRVTNAMAKWPRGELVVDAWRATLGAGNPSDGAPRATNPSAKALPASTPDQRVTALGQWVGGKKTLPHVAEAAGLPDVTRDACVSLGHELRRMSHAVLGTWDELLTSRELLAATFAGEPGFGASQLDVVHDWCVRQARVRAEGERDGEVASIDTEDVALLLRLWQVLRSPLPAADGSPLRFAHLFVDEVQDSTPIELRVLVDLTTKDRSITLAGDAAQRTVATRAEGAASANANAERSHEATGGGEDDESAFDWHAVLADLDDGSTEGGTSGAATLEPLKVSYRSTAEITNFARAVLGPYAHDEVPLTTRHGPPVELFAFGSVGESVAFLADALRDLASAEPEASVALVSRFPQQADAVFEGLLAAEVPRVRRVAEQDFTWEPGFDVTDVRQTKGLEFDEVILLETTATSYPDKRAARQALYVGATRAAHQLWCVASEKPSPVVAAALEAASTTTTAGT